MREVEFRAWDNISKRMARVHDMAFHGDNLWEVRIRHYGGDMDVSLFGDDFELMQYTGLKDKNGRKIYEGDIVKYRCNSAGDYTNKTFAIDEVNFIRGGFHCKRTFSQLWAKGNSCTEDGKLLDVEIISNIWERPELLEKNNDS